MKLIDSIICAVLVLLLCCLFGGLFSGVYWLALRFTHDSPESIFVPYFMFAFILLVIMIYLSTWGSDKNK